MDQALVQDVVAEVMKRLGDRVGGDGRISMHYRPRGGVAAGEESAANDDHLRDKTGVSVPVGEHGIFSDVDSAVKAASEAQKKLVKLSLDERDQIVKLVKSMAKQNAQAWGKMEFDETKIGRLDHKIEK